MRTAIHAAAVGLCLLCDSCSCVVYTPWNPPDEAYEVTPGQPAEAPAPPARPVEVKFLNETGRQVCYFYVSASARSTWGRDQLGASQMLEPDGTLTVTLDEAVTEWDLLLLDCDQRSILELRRQPLPADHLWHLTVLRSDAVAPPGGEAVVGPGAAPPAPAPVEDEAGMERSCREQGEQCVQYTMRLRASGRADAALELLRSLCPGGAGWACFDEGQVLEELGRAAEAEAVWRAGCERNDGQYCGELARLLRRQERIPEAEELERRACELDPDSCPRP